LKKNYCSKQEVTSLGKPRGKQKEKDGTHLQTLKFEKAEDFITVLKHLYQNVLNDAAHPTFVITNDMVIPRSMLNDN
jgi:hypothetical protein